MYIFLGFTTVLLFLGLYQISVQGRQLAASGKLFMIVSFAGLLIIAGCRGLDIGSDTPMYVRNFLSMSGISDIGNYLWRFEWGYCVYMGVLSQFSSNAHVLLFISSFITLFMIYRVIYKYSLVPWYSILMFVFLMFYYNSMNIMRQYIAVSLALLAMPYLGERKRFKFVILVVLAGLFHSTAFAFILMLPLSMIKLTKKRRLVLVIAAVIVAVGIEQILQLIIQVFPKYAGYLTSEDYYLQGKLGTFLRMAVYFVLFLFLNYVYKDRDELDEWTNLEYAAGLLGFAISLAALQGDIIGRVSVYFALCFCVSIPNALTAIQSKKDKYIWAFAILVGSLAYNLVILVFRPYWSGVLPYTFWN